MHCIDESEVLTPADDEDHIDKHQFKVPFVCGRRNLGEALRRIAEGQAETLGQLTAYELKRSRGASTRKLSDPDAVARCWTWSSVQGNTPPPGARARRLGRPVGRASMTVAEE